MTNPDNIPFAECSKCFSQRRLREPITLIEYRVQLHRVSICTSQQHFELINLIPYSQCVNCLAVYIFGNNVMLYKLTPYSITYPRSVGKRCVKQSIARDVLLQNHDKTGAPRPVHDGLCKLLPVSATDSRLCRIRLNVH